MKLFEVIKPTRTIFVVKKKEKEEYLTATKGARFGTFQDAALFFQEKNAAAAIRSVKRRDENPDPIYHSKDKTELEIIKCILRG